MSPDCYDSYDQPCFPLNMLRHMQGSQKMTDLDSGLDPLQHDPVFSCWCLERPLTETFGCEFRISIQAEHSRRAQVAPQKPARKTPGPTLSAHPAAQPDASCLCWTLERRPAGLVCDPSGGGVWPVYQGTRGGSRWCPCGWAQSLKVPC